MSTEEATEAPASTKPATPDIPKKMKKLVLLETNYKEGAPAAENIANVKMEVQEVDVPTPQSNEVLVKVVAAPVNPSDYGKWFRAQAKDLPQGMGAEGCGIVVATGGGLMTKRLKIGSAVGLITQDPRTYAEYAVFSATEGLFPLSNLPPEVPVEDAASFFVNPFTTIAILETARSHYPLLAGKGALIHTAAASQLGQMMVKMAPGEKMEVINIVRREEQVQLLEKIGAKHIINSSQDNWKDTLKAKVAELNVTVAFDAVGGSMTADLMECLPSKGTVYVYGGLSGGKAEANVMDMIYRKKEMKGFILNDWIQHGGTLMMVPRMLSTTRKVVAGLGKDGWSASQFQDTTLDNMQSDLIKTMKDGVTGKKLRIRFDK